MLQLKNIKKDYYVADTVVNALKGIDVCFRESEFVSILGPSGCGKTTMLNIIGGLDHYTSGDLVIDGISTKEYSDRDWDTYRNHRIGFIFQSYNLIPHQTVLENVELALNISGIAKQERVERAKEALDKVGLSGQYNKKPNQLSGGQCQRVAIARALVSNPDILLADEPTGALDTVTSVQIMDLIKEISKERLVIMVTHNPELAEKYSTRIIRLLDGEIISDTMPYEYTASDATEENKEDNSEPKIKKAKKVISKKSKLSFWSAFKLSARNLKSKLKRTLLVCLAGSIGITGVASVLAVSNGITKYITKMQDDMLSGNPITIQEETLNLSALEGAMDTSSGSDAIKESIVDGKVNVDKLIDFLVKKSGDFTSMQVSNDITLDYVNYVKNMPNSSYAAMSLEYGVNITNNLYTNFNFTNLEGKKLSLSSAKQTYISMLALTEYKDLTMIIPTLSDTFMQLPDSKDYILSQYDFITPETESKYPESYDEIMIVVNDEQELTDLLLAQLGYYTQDEFLNVMYKAAEDSNYNSSLDKQNFSFEELLGKTFTYYPNNVIYTRASDLSKIVPFTYSNEASDTWQGVDLKITAILKPKEGLSYGSLQSGFYYNTNFIKKVIEDNITSEIVEYLKSENLTQFESLKYMGKNTGITYNYEFYLNNENHKEVGFVGKISQESLMASIMGGSNGTSSKIPTMYTLSLRDLGGIDLPNLIKIYPNSFDEKDLVVEYLDAWNGDDNIVVGDKTILATDRQEIIYTDALSLVIGLINELIRIVTIALVCFTALSLIVSTVMIAIITYVSVIERVKEIGVIRSLGGRKLDVSNLFVAETFIIGASSGMLGILATYGLSLIINLIINKLAQIGSIASLSIVTALIMIAISIALTLISGLIPARLAAKKDPVDALRSE